VHDERLPAYHELPVVAGAPPGSSWGLWGADDQLGTLNLLNDERTLRAVQTVRRGAVFPLGLPLEEPEPSIVWRTRPVHRILRVGHERRGMEAGGVDDPASGLVDRDDVVDNLWLQGSSQWDGLTHIRHPEYGNYNGVADADIHGGPGTKLGIDRWAGRGVTGRGVLVDIERHLAAAGRPYDPTTAYQISVDDVVGALDRQGTVVETGDILLLHTGWLQRVIDADPPTRAAMLDLRKQGSPGLEVSERTLEFLWNTHVAAIAADNIGVEAAGPGLHFALHQQLLPLLGIPLGEYWVLDALAADCAVDGRYEFLLVSVPLNLRGAVGSPPQALAIK
jgi:kynurenine formamidase